MDLDIGDIPIPPEQRHRDEVQDQFEYNVAFNLAFIGVGQGGSRIAQTFHHLGYARAAALNTTNQDLVNIALPAPNKLDLGGAGAGKDPAVGRAAVEERSQDIRDLLKRSWGEEVDYAFVCFGAGGGTGAGAYEKVVEVAGAYMKEIGRPVRVGLIVALPKDAEGQRPARNTIMTMKRLVKLKCSPVIVIDNQKINTIYRPTASKEYEVANGSVAKLLHLFNRLGGSESELTNFDRQDLAKLLDSGVVAFGAGKVTSWDDPTAISQAVREQLTNNTLASVDLKQGNSAGLIFVLNGSAYEEVSVGSLDHTVQMMTNILAKGSTVYQGVYKGTSGGENSIQILAMIGSLPWPKERLQKLAALGGADVKDVAKFLNV